MSVEWFLKLKEFDSLTKVKLTQMKALKDQDDRLSSLSFKQDKSIQETATLKLSRKRVEDFLFETEKKLNTFIEQKKRLFDVGQTDKAESLTAEIEELENKGLEYLEQIDHLEQELADHKTFELGLEKTILEIQSEVTNEKEKIQKEIGHIDLRLESLENELPQDFQSILKKTLAKNLAYGAFTRIQDGSCFFCRYKISRTDESEVDKQKSLRVCPQCDRIFLPYGS